MSIDDTGKCYFKGDDYTGPFTGNFKGQLSIQQLEKLNYLLQHSELEKMLTWKQGNIVMDAPGYWFKFGYNNGKQLLIYTNEPPLNMVDLISFLLASYKDFELMPDSEKRSFN